MKTPKSYQNNIKNRIITKEMLVDCLYSSNKRAKNYRDKEREYREYSRYNRYFYDKYDNIGKCQEKKEAYYKQKEIILSILKPTCIHKEFHGYKKVRYYDYEDKYYELAKAKKFVWENCYWDEELGRTVWFGDILNEKDPIYFYYLFYDLNSAHSFHTPIKEKDISKKYSDLKIVEINELNTFGATIENLISNQFVKKVIELIKSGDYTLILD